MIDSPNEKRQVKEETELRYLAKIGNFAFLRPVHCASPAGLGHRGVELWPLVSVKIVGYETLCMTSQSGYNSLQKALGMLSRLIEQPSVTPRVRDQ